MDNYDVLKVRGQLCCDINRAVSDQDCHRFLAARNYDAGQAVAMIEDWWKWWNTPLGNELPPAKLLTLSNLEDPLIEVYCNLIPHCHGGFGKSGHPIFWERAGEIGKNLYALQEHFDTNSLVARHIRIQMIMEIRMLFISRKINKQIDQAILVCDCQNMPLILDSFGMNYCRQVFLIDQNYYPERLYRTYFINVPWGFSAFLSTMLSWIDPVTSEKMRILGTDFLETLREEIDEDSIPVEFGGEKEDFRWGWPYSDESGASPEQLKTHLSGANDSSTLSM